MNEQPRPGARRHREPNPVVDWVRAIALGIRDTANDMLDEGRKGAREAYDEYWDRYDAKVKRRSRRP